jgi:choline dehydrogenase
VLDRALVTRVVLDGNRATGVTIDDVGVTRTVDAGSEVILSLGAINTPRVLMQSGISDAADLQRIGIPVAADLPGVGRNYQDHPRVDRIWEYAQMLPPRNVAGDATVFWRSSSALDGPDLQVALTQMPVTSAECAAKFDVPEQGWTISAMVARPQSRGTVRLTGPDPGDPVRVDANLLSHPDDMTAMTACVELARDIGGNSRAMRPFATHEVMPGDLKGHELAAFIRAAAVTVLHSTGTAKMGRDGTSVVNGNLKVHGIDRLRIADGSIMPRIATGNTIAPCVIIGERAGWRHPHH